MRTGQSKAQYDCLTARIRKLKVAAATSDGELGVVVRPVRSSNSRIAGGDDRENAAESQAHETSGKMPELRALVEGLYQTFGGKRVGVASSMCRVGTRPVLHYCGPVGE